MNAHDALIRARRRWIRTHRIDSEIPERLLPTWDPVTVWPYLATAQVQASRRAKRCWRRRVSRARHTKHAHRTVIARPPLPFNTGHEVGIYSDPDDYPADILRPPWLRASALVRKP